MKPEQEYQKSGTIFMPLLTGVLGGFTISLLMLCVFSAVFASRDTPQAAIVPMACISIAAGAFAGGFVAAKTYQSRGLVTGAIAGLIFFGVLYITGAIMKQIDVGMLAFIKFLISVLLGSLGGIVGVNTRHRRSRT